MKLASPVTKSATQAIPLHAEGMRIGLLGGSFNPPHEAHRAITLFAIKRLQLDRVWWLVTPGNPLKEHGALRTLEQRAEAARRMAAGSRSECVSITGILKPLTPHVYYNPRATQGFGARDTVKGMVPGHICIVQVCFTQDP